MTLPAIAGASCPCVRRLHLRAAILVTALLGCALGATHAQGLQSSDDQHTIHGIVVNAATHTPIPRALVYSADDHFAMMTDSDGHFEFATKPGTQVWLLARKPGFLGDRNTGRAFEGLPGHEVTVLLTPESIINGRVSTSTGETLARVDVQLLSRQVHDGFDRWLPTANIQTRSDGSFRFAELTAGSYKVMTREFLDRDPAISAAPSYGFPPVYFPAAADFSGGATIDLAAGQTFEANLTITDQPYYPVKIPVTSGEMNAGMDIRVTLQGRPGPGYSLGYNANSHTIEGLLPNGNYTVLAFTYGLDSASGEVSLRVAGAPAEGPALTLTRNSSVTLNVQEMFTQTDSQSPTPGLNRRLRGPRNYLYPQLEPADDFAPWVTTNARAQNNANDNSLVLQGILPGRYRLRLNTSRGYVASATMGGIDLLHQPFEVGSGSNIPIEITMRDDAASLDITVAPPSSETAAGSSQLWLYCVSLAGGPESFHEQAIWSGVKSTISGLAPGTYRVMAFSTPHNYLPYRDPEAMRAFEGKGQVIQLEAGQSASLQLQVIPDE